MQETFEFMENKDGKGAYQLPTIALLDPLPPPGKKVSKEEMLAESELLARKLLDFDIEGRITQVYPGPVVTMFEFEPAPGVKVSRIVNLADDLALAMRAGSVRIVAPLPGKAGGRHRGAEQHPRDRLFPPDHRNAGVSGEQVQAQDPARQGHLRRVGHRQHRQDAPSARCRRHRLRQERCHQLHHPGDPVQCEAERGEACHDRPQDAGALGLRRHSRICSRRW